MKLFCKMHLVFLHALWPCMFLGFNIFMSISLGHVRGCHIGSLSNANRMIKSTSDLVNVTLGNDFMIYYS